MFHCWSSAPPTTLSGPTYTLWCAQSAVTPRWRREPSAIVAPAPKEDCPLRDCPAVISLELPFGVLVYPARISTVANLVGSWASRGPAIRAKIPAANTGRRTRMRHSLGRKIGGRGGGRPARGAAPGGGGGPPTPP